MFPRRRQTPETQGETRGKCRVQGEKPGGNGTQSRKMFTFAQMETLLPQVGEPLRWYVLRVTYSRELLLKVQLEAWGVECFLPMRYIKRMREGRWRRLRVPAVHNLLFAYTSHSVIERIRTMQGAGSPMRYIMDCATGRPLVVPDDVMHHFIAVAGSAEEQVLYLSAEETRCRPGDRVRVTAGLFAGVEGRWVRVRGDRRVVVELTGLMSVATACVPPSMVSPL